MFRRTFSTVVGAFILLASSPAQQQEPMAPDAHPTFEVATIKPTDPNSTREGFPFDGHHVACFGETVENMLLMAYGIHTRQIVDAPEWLSKDHYDVEGVSDVPGEPSVAQTQEMFRKLLADRFHLRFHEEKRDLPIYALTIAKGGPNLAPTKPGEHLNQGSRQNGGRRTLKFTNMPMRYFALNMNFYLDRPMIDQTGLTGSYDFTVTYTFDTSRVDDTDPAPSLFTAVKEQLGLKLEAVRGPAPVYVIDHAERPTAN